MINTSKLCVLIISIYFTGNILSSQLVSEKLKITQNSNSIFNVLEYIKICRWKEDASACVNFSFDDNNLSSKKISQIFDNYRFKTTFFVIPSYMFVDSLKDILASGHEIGNHTYSHPYLALLDSFQLDTEVRKSKEIIENTFGIKCVSFSEPFSSRSQLSLKTALKYHLFVRDYVEYPENKHIILRIAPNASNAELMSYLKCALNSGSLFEIEGHGIDGDGYEPISKELLVQNLDSIKFFIISVIFSYILYNIIFFIYILY